jgi:hypothetical protein
MAGEKKTRKCYGPKGMIENLRKCPWIKWSKPGTSFEGFEFDGNRLHDKSFVAKSKCKITVQDLATGDEFIEEGFCCPNLLVTFFLNETQWKLMQIAGYYMTPTLTGTNINPYRVSMEILKGSSNAD